MIPRRQELPPTYLSDAQQGEVVARSRYSSDRTTTVEPGVEQVRATPYPHPLRRPRPLLQSAQHHSEVLPFVWRQIAVVACGAKDASGCFRQAFPFAQEHPQIQMDRRIIRIQIAESILSCRYSCQYRGPNSTPVHCQTLYGALLPATRPVIPSCCIRSQQLLTPVKRRNENIAADGARMPVLRSPCRHVASDGSGRREKCSPSHVLLTQGMLLFFTIRHPHSVILVLLWVRSRERSHPAHSTGVGDPACETAWPWPVLHQRQPPNQDLPEVERILFRSSGRV